MKKFTFTKIHVVFSILILWVGISVYLVTDSDGQMFKGQFFNSAAQSCEEIAAALSQPNISNASELVDAALGKDCALDAVLLNQIESKLIQEQTSNLPNL